MHEMKVMNVKLSRRKEANIEQSEYERVRKL